MLGALVFFTAVAAELGQLGVVPNSRRPGTDGVVGPVSQQVRAALTKRGMAVDPLETTASQLAQRGLKADDCQGARLCVLALLKSEPWAESVVTVDVGKAGNQVFVHLEMLRAGNSTPLVVADYSLNASAVSSPTRELEAFAISVGAVPPPPLAQVTAETEALPPPPSDTGPTQVNVGLTAATVVLMASAAVMLAAGFNARRAYYASRLTEPNGEIGTDLVLSQAQAYATRANALFVGGGGVGGLALVGVVASAMRWLGVWGPPPVGPRRAAGALALLVVSLADKSPVAGARVLINGIALQTDSTGRLETTESPGLVGLAVSAEGFAVAQTSTTILADKRTAVTIALPLEQARSLATVSGHVRSAQDGRPLPAELAIAEMKVSVRANNSGSFSIMLPEGTYRMQVSTPGFAPQLKSVTLKSRDHVIFNVDLNPR